MKRFSTMVLVGLLVVSLCRALPAETLSRPKRGFRVNSADRVAHGYGKRDFNTWDDSAARALKSPAGSELMTVQELSQLAARNPTLIEALIEKFIDVDGDGIVSSSELFGLDAQ